MSYSNIPLSTKIISTQEKLNEKVAEDITEIKPYPSWLSTKGAYAPGSKFLPHSFQSDYALTALEECQLKKKFNITELKADQKTAINDFLLKNRRKFIAFDVVGWMAFGLNI